MHRGSDAVSAELGVDEVSIGLEKRADGARKVTDSCARAGGGDARGERRLPQARRVVYRRSGAAEPESRMYLMT